jgi:hypothetical protein
MLFLVTSKPTETPGRYGRKGKTSSEVIGSVANALISTETLKEMFWGGPSVCRLYEAGQGGDLSLAVQNVKSGPLATANAIDKKSALNCHLKHDANLYRGLFVSSKQYELLLKMLPTDDTDIVICGVDEAQALFPASRPCPGIHFQYQDQLVPATDFSISVFELLRVAIVEIFSKLGAKRISLQDNTDIKAEVKACISKEVLALAPSLGLNLSRSSKFSLDATLVGIACLVDEVLLQKIKEALHLAPELQKLAEHAALNPRTLKVVKKDISLNISFGMNINLLAAFQGSFTGGYERALTIEIVF